MKNRIAVAALAAIISGAIAVPAFAGPRSVDPDITRQEVATFDAYLDRHPALAGELQANPGLVNDREFVGRHREFAAFMREHPRVREELREHPGQLLPRREHFDSQERAESIPPEKIAALDRFLDSHRDTAE